MKRAKNIGIYAVIFGLVLAMVWFYNSGTKEDQKEVKTSTMIKYLKEDEVENINVTETKLTAKLKSGDKVYAYVNSAVDLSYIYDSYIMPQVDSGKLKLESDEPKKESIWLSLLPTLIMIGIMVVFFILIMNQSGGGGKAMSFGKSRAKLQKDGDLKKITFKDVAGLEEEKEELEEVVEFLKHPAEFEKLGAKIPHGVLLMGPPGTGKTLLAKAVAGEANVPFYSISGSDFVEMYVGVGASRVRDLFETARRHPASIVFIDEIDAVGRQRGTGLGGGHDEREQTLNQLLVEMDGFGVGGSNVIVMAATNRADILDPALLRPGRFDRQITVNYPDIRGREAILHDHAKGKPFESDVDFSTIAKTTVGFTGADLANLLNEAALLAARRKKALIGMNDIEDAMLKVIVGPQKKAKAISEKEKKLTAYHEAGHAIATKFIAPDEHVHQISIIPSGRAGGFTLSLPNEDRSYKSRGDMISEIVVLLGGRCAEALIMGDISTGASNDIERATTIAHSMVTRYGMSEKLGTVVYGHDQSSVFLGRDFSSAPAYSENTAALIDGEVLRIINEAYAKVEEILKTHMDKLHFVAGFLFKNEVMEADQFEAAMQDGEHTFEEIEALRSERAKRSEAENAEAKRRREAEDAERRKKAAEDAAKRLDEASDVEDFDDTPKPKD